MENKSYPSAVFSCTIDESREIIQRISLETSTPTYLIENELLYRTTRDLVVNVILENRKLKLSYLDPAEIDCECKLSSREGEADLFVCLTKITDDSNSMYFRDESGFIWRGFEQLDIPLQPASAKEIVKKIRQTKGAMVYRRRHRIPVDVLIKMGDGRFSIWGEKKEHRDGSPRFCDLSKLSEDFMPYHLGGRKNVIIRQIPEHAKHNLNIGVGKLFYEEDKWRLEI